MQPLHDLAQTILQILSNSAWQGMGVIISSVLSVTAIYLARRPQPLQRQLPARNFKKIWKRDQIHLPQQQDY